MTKRKGSGALTWPWPGCTQAIRLWELALWSTRGTRVLRSWLVASTPDPFAAATVRGNETELRTRKDGGEWVDEKGAVHSGACDPNPRVHSTSGSRARTYSTKIVTPLSHPNGEKLSRRIKRNVRIVAETRPSGGEIGGWREDSRLRS